MGGCVAEKERKKKNLKARVAAETGGSLNA
jgi:hypothetical protein